MTFDVEIAGRVRKVNVSRGDAGYRVTVDGHAFAADVASAARGGLSLLLTRLDAGTGEPAAAGGTGAKSEPEPEPGTPAESYDISLVERPDGVTLVYVNGRLVPVLLSRSGRSAAGRAASGRGKPGSGPSSDQQGGMQRLVAPMPGKIVKVLVKAGDAVVARQGLVVIEAMKMENELRSPKAGTVTEVRAVEGALVDAGAILVMVE